MSIQNTESLEGELWKPIPGHEGYEVSTFGRIKSLAGKRKTTRYEKPTVANIKERIRKLWIYFKRILWYRLI